MGCGQTIKSLREYHNLAQNKVSGEAGFNFKTLGKIERGDKNPDARTVERFVWAIDILSGNALTYQEIDAVRKECGCQFYRNPQKDPKSIQWAIETTKLDIDAYSAGPAYLLDATTRFLCWNDWTRIFMQQAGIPQAIISAMLDEPKSGGKRLPFFHVLYNEQMPASAYADNWDSYAKRNFINFYGSVSAFHDEPWFREFIEDSPSLHRFLEAIPEEELKKQIFLQRHQFNLNIGGKTHPHVLNVQALEGDKRFWVCTYQAYSEPLLSP